MRRGLTEPGVAARLKSDRAVAQARALRRAMTPAEKALWRLLKEYAPADAHVRRQAPIGPFIVDFASHAARLAIEVDGGVHAVRGAEDAEREAWLRGRGYEVLRFRNEDVRADIGVVVRAIAAKMTERLAER